MVAVIIGAGAVTAIGLNAASTAAAQRAGIAGHNAHPFMIDRAGKPMIVCRVPWGEQWTDGAARMAELAVAAALQALDYAQLDRPIDVLLALPEPRPGLPENFVGDIGAQLRKSLASKIAVREVVVRPAGHAGGLALLNEGTLALSRTPGSRLLVGGVDTWLVPETLEWLDEREILHSTTMPWGFCPGEAAAFCLLGGEQEAGGRMTIVGSGDAVEANSIASETVCIGAGLGSAWRQALRGLAGTAHRADWILCDLNGEPYRADELAFSVLRTRELLADDVDIVTPTDCWGDVGAATGPLCVIVAAFAAAKAYAPGPICLTSSSSIGGGRSALLLYDRGWATPGRAR